MPRFNRMVVNGAISDRNIFRHSVFVQVKCLQATNTKKYLLLKPHRLPSDEEYAEARRSLDAVGWQVDYIITHCAPTSIALMGSRHNEADRLTDFLQDVRERAKYHYLLFGHYHDNKAVDEKHILLWEQIVRVI